MGKKYLETKKNSLESSVLGVWQTAIEEGDDRMDGRTKQYKSHRSKLEAARLRREERKKLNKEEFDLDEGKMKELHGYIEDGKSAEWIAKKMGVDVKTIKALMKETLDEASGDKEAYQKFFDAALKKFKVSSPAELKGDQKKKFFDYIDKNWEGDDEKAEQVKEFKIQSMKAALAQIWGMEEGNNPFVEHKGTEPHKHPHHDQDDEEQEEDNKKKVKTETGKKPATIDLKPKIDDK